MATQGKARQMDKDVTTGGRVEPLADKHQLPVRPIHTQRRVPRFPTPMIEP